MCLCDSTISLQLNGFIKLYPRDFNILHWSYHFKWNTTVCVYQLCMYMVNFIRTISGCVHWQNVMQLNCWKDGKFGSIELPREKKNELTTTIIIAIMMQFECILSTRCCHTIQCIGTFIDSYFMLRFTYILKLGASCRLNTMLTMFILFEWQCNRNILEREKNGQLIDYLYWKL